MKRSPALKPVNTKSRRSKIHSNVKNHSLLRRRINKIIIVKTIIILIFSFIPIVWIIQQNPNVQKSITEKLIDVLQQEWDVQINVEYYDINFFTGKIFLNNGKVESLPDSDKKFFWNFEKAKISFSRLDYFFKDYFLMDVVFKRVDVKTFVKNGQLDISKHIEKIAAQGSSIGGRLQSIVVNNLCFGIEYDDKELLIKMQGSFGLKKFGNFFIGQYWTGFLFLNDGLITVNKKILVKDLKINSIFTENIFFSNIFNQTVFGSFFCLGNDYSVTGSNNIINISDEDGFSNFSLNFNSSDNLNFKGDTKINLFTCISNFFNSNNRKKHLMLLSENSIDGDCSFDLKFSNGRLNGDIILSNLSVPILKKSRWLGTIDFSSLEDKKTVCLKNLSEINLFDSWVINPNCFNLELNFDKDLNFTGDYTIKGIKQDKTFLCKAGCFLKGNDFKTYGFMNKDYFGIDLFIKPFFHFKKILYTRGKEKLINFYSRKKHLMLRKDKIGILAGNIDFKFFKFFFPHSLKRYVFGKNVKFCLNIDQSHSGSLSGDAFFKGGKLSLLKSYNSVEKFKFNFSFDKLQKKLYLNNFFIKFFKGNMFSSKIDIGFDDNFYINFFHLPLKISNLLINWKKDFYGLLQGNLLLEQRSKKVTDVTGDIILKKSLFKENLFGFNNEDVGNLSFFVHPLSLDENIINFDINISNLMPVKIKTGFASLDLNSHLNLKLMLANGRFFNPKIIGSLVIENGMLDFLQHKLFIDYGKIQFIPSRVNDPIIDFIAKNKIKKYLITLHATGSLSSPKIILESFPKLNKKQILALLVAGSPNASFKAQFSQILQRNLSNLNKKNSFLKKITQPFKFVQIAPAFSSRAGKSGLNGSIDIDLTDQIHARLQKNFNLQDDLSFEVDYFVTDDVNIQFIKDKRGELGAQVEVRLIL